MNIIKDRLELWQVLPKGLVVAELGTFVGDYAQKILEINEPSKLYIVDIFFKGKGTQWDVTVEDMSLYFDILTQKYIDNPDIFIIKSTTQTFLESIAKDILDIVYIDADHSYQAVKQDLELSFQKVKTNGYICGHDYDHQSVRQALNEFLIKHNQEILYLTDDKTIDRSFVIQKK